MHADHLNSATRITDVNGLEIRRLAYTSFGEEAENQGTGDEPKYTYTGKEHDATGLYYYGARYYDPALSRFITADTVYDAGPQGLNRYSYALNNPIRYRDPSGHFVNGPNDSQDPDDYGCITGSQNQFANGTATVHVGSTYEDVWGRGITLDEYDAGGDVFFPLDPRIYTSPYPNYPSPDPVGYVKGKLQDLARQLYDEGGSVQQRIVDTQQGMMDELISQYASVVEMADQTGGVISGWQIRLVSETSEKVMNFSYDTASGGLRPRENSLWYKTGKYGTAVIIFLATIKASGGSSKNTKLTAGGKKVLKDPKLRALKDKTVAEAIKIRGGGGSQIGQVSTHLRNKSLGEVANMAAKEGNSAAETAIKMVKQAASKAQRYSGK